MMTRWRCDQPTGAYVLIVASYIAHRSVIGLQYAPCGYGYYSQSPRGVRARVLALILLRDNAGRTSDGAVD